MAGEARAASDTDGGAQGFLVRGEADHVDGDGLAGQRMGLAADAAVGDAGDGEHDGFDFGRHELLAADVDGLAETTEDAQGAVGSVLHLIPGAKPAVRGEAFVAGVEIARDLRAAAQPKLVGDDLPFEAWILKPQEGGSRHGALGPGDAGLARAEGLDEANPGEG